MEFIDQRNITFLLISLVTIVIIYEPLKDLLKNTDQSEY